MKREAAQPFARQRAVARLLASTMRSHNEFATLRAAGLDGFVFDNDNHQRVWEQPEAHYARTTDAPSLDQIRMGLGRWSDNLVEVECAEPVSTEELPGLVDEVLIDRQVRSHNSLRMQAQIALGKNDLRRAHELLEACFSLEEHLGVPARVAPRLPAYSPLATTITDVLQPGGGFASQTTYVNVVRQEERHGPEFDDVWCQCRR